MTRLTILAGFVAAVMASQPATCEYSFTTFDVPGATITGGRGINARGDVVGYYQTGPAFEDVHAFLLSDGVFTTIDFPGSPSDRRAFGIDKHGLIAVSFQREG